MNHLSTVRAVVFDLDGLLIDTESIFAQVARRLVARRDKPFDESVLARMMGTPARQAIPVLRELHGLTDTDEAIAAECRELFFAVLGDQPVRFLPGALDLLASLALGRRPLALATSSSAAYVRTILEPHPGVLDRFQHVLTCDDVTLGKPHPEVYQKAADRLGLEPIELLVLEDSPNGMRAAKGAGARCVVVPHHLVPLDQLEGADAILESLEEPRLWACLGLQRRTESSA